MGEHEGRMLLFHLENRMRIGTWIGVLHLRDIVGPRSIELSRAAPTIRLFYLRWTSPNALTPIDAGLHERADAAHAQLEVVGSDMGCVAHQEGERLARLHHATRVVLSQLLAELEAERLDGSGGAGITWKEAVMLTK